jgi:hypothetical protein
MSDSQTSQCCNGLSLILDMMRTAAVAAVAATSAAAAAAAAAG